MEIKPFIKLAKEIIFRTPLKKYHGFPIYVYCFTPPQLCFLCHCIEATKQVAGNIAEVGCFDGSTTVFLNKYMDAQNIKKNYHAVDTFSGFIQEDIEYEVAERKKKRDFYSSFRVNNKKWFDWTMQYNNVSRVHSVQVDVNNYDFKTLAPLSFALLDVDLYGPMKNSLPRLYDILSPGGIIVCDDCADSDVRWDGANQAYSEFMQEIGQPVQVMHGKLGIIKK